MIFQMGLLKFGFLCIDFLAWPMLALAYPLCASIRAIETGSKYHMRKLVTYWTVLSIVSLFEHTLRVVEWVPFWPYIKLVGTFWLVIPRFDGACYAYDCLVSADLGEKLHCILSQFSSALFAHKHLSKDIKAMEQTTEQGTEERKSIDIIKAMEQTTEQVTEERKSIDIIKAMEQTTKQVTEERKSIDIKAMEQTTEQGTEERKSEDIKAMEQKTEQGTEERKSEDIKAMEQTTEQGTEERKSLDIKAMEQTTEQGTEERKSEDIRAMEQTTEQGTEQRKFEDIKAMEQTTEQETEERKSIDTKAMEQTTEQETEERKSIDTKAMEQTTEQETEERKSIDTKAMEQTTEQETEERKSIDTKAMEQTTEQETEERKSIDTKAMEQTTEQETEERKSIDTKAMEQTTEQETEERKSIDSKAMEQTTEQETEERKVKSAVDNIGEIQRKETEATWVKGIVMPNAAEENIIPEINPSKLIQREWTCAVCQVTASSENDLKSHLGGKRHRAKCLELKPIKHAPTKGESKKKNNGKQEKKVQANAPGIKEKQVKENNVSVGADSRLYCGFCNVWCSDEVAMASHLKGRKHLSTLKQTAVLIANELAKHTPKQETNVKPEKATDLQNQVKNEPAKNSKQKTKVQANASGQKERQVKENNASASTDSTLHCSLCNIWAPCEAGMVSHLKGRKHLSNLKQMGILMG